MTAVQESRVNSKSSDLLPNFSYLYINYPKWLGCGGVVFLNGTICNCNCVIFHTNGLKQETIQRKMLSPVPWEALLIFSNRKCQSGWCDCHANSDTAAVASPKKSLRKENWVRCRNTRGETDSVRYTFSNRRYFRKRKSRTRTGKTIFCLNYVTA